MSTQTVTELNQRTIDIIKSTVPVLQEQGDAITKRFYEMMLGENPELKNIFNQTNQRKGDQSKALANAVYAAAAHIDRLEEILPVVTQIAHKHKSLNIKPHHYPIVGKYLLLAIKDVLKDAATEDIMTAWEKAYGIIAEVFIQVEGKMYNELEATPGGWIGYRGFKVVKKVKESDVITSFYLDAADGGPFPTHQAGQYITVKAEIEEEPYTHLRQYTLSCAPGEEYYRISVKREDSVNGNPKGVVSNFLHEQIEEGDIIPISAPAGDFTLDQTDSRPLILISGGVGLTPMMSMLETVIKKQPEREVHFIHAAQSSKVHAMKDRVQEITNNHDQVKSYIVYNDPEKEDEGSYDKKGIIDEEYLATIIPTADAAYYFCGPTGFMQAMYKHLTNLDVSSEDIHYEVFGPATAIAK